MTIEEAASVIWQRAQLWRRRARLAAALGQSDVELERNNIAVELELAAKAICPDIGARHDQAAFAVECRFDAEVAQPCPSTTPPS